MHDLLMVVQENVHRINIHHLALFNTEQCHLWLAFWCDFFGAILVVATCLFSVGLKDSLGSAAVGLAISNTIQVRSRPQSAYFSNNPTSVPVVYRMCPFLSSLCNSFGSPMVCHNQQCLGTGCERTGYSFE